MPRGSLAAKLYVWPVLTSVKRPAFKFAEGTFLLQGFGIRIPKALKVEKEIGFAAKNFFWD